MNDSSHMTGGACDSWCVADNYRANYCQKYGGGFGCTPNTPGYDLQDHHGKDGLTGWITRFTKSAGKTVLGAAVATVKTSIHAYECFDGLQCSGYLHDTKDQISAIHHLPSTVKETYKAARNGHSAEVAGDLFAVVVMAVAAKKLDLTEGYSKPCSFSANTPVLMGDGKTKPIGNLHPGEKVQTADPKTGKHKGARTVTATWINHDTDLLDLVVETAPGHDSVLHTTSNHPLWDDTTHSWTPASKLTPGHALVTAHNTHVHVTATRLVRGVADMYNLTVDQFHTYYVLAGTTPVLVHNTCGDPKVWEPFREGVDHTDQGTLPAEAGIPAGAPLDPGEYHFIVRKDGSLRAVENESMWNLNPDAGHTSLGDRQGVFMAGTFDVDADGTISRIDNFSGHYQPTNTPGFMPLVDVTREAFRGHGWDFADNAWEYYAGR